MRDIRPDFKRCSCCGEIKERDDFSPSKDTKNKVLTLKSKCKICVAKIAAQKRATKEGRAAANAARRKNYKKYREEQIAVTRAWQKANPDKVAHNNRNWALRHPEQYRAILAAKSTRRRAQELLATPKWVSHKDILEIYDLAQNLAVMTGVERHVDHIVPLCGKNVCGLHVAWNLQVLTAEENRTKSSIHESDVSLTDLI